MSAKKNKEQDLQEKLNAANEEISVLKKKIENEQYKLSKWHTSFWDDSTHFSINNEKKEKLLIWMDYKVFNMPNCEKNIFHDALKGFEEFSKLKGYIVFLSIDTSLNDKIAFKFDLPDGSSKWSRNKIYKNLDEYLIRIKENKGVDDIKVNCSKLQEFQLKSNLKNRMLIIQHAYTSFKEIFDFSLNRKDSEIKQGKEKIRLLQMQMESLEKDRNSGEEEKALLEMKLSDLRIENQLYQNECFRKDSVIEHLREILVESLSAQRQIINVNGDLNMRKKIGNICADRSNVMIDSANSTQLINTQQDINELLNKMLKVSENDDGLSKKEYISISNSINEIKSQLECKNPDGHIIKENINFLGSVSSIASFAGQLTPLIATFCGMLF